MYTLCEVEKEYQCVKHARALAESWQSSKETKLRFLHLHCHSSMCIDLTRACLWNDWSSKWLAFKWSSVRVKYIIPNSQVLMFTRPIFSLSMFCCLFCLSSPLLWLCVQRLGKYRPPKRLAFKCSPAWVKYTNHVFGECQWHDYPLHLLL